MTLPALRSHATVTIERPARYAKQLVSHLSNKVESEEVDGGWQLHIATGVGTVLPQVETLELRAEAPSEEALERIQDVLGRHLIKFAAKLGDVSVDWIRD